MTKTIADGYANSVMETEGIGVLQGRLLDWYQGSRRDLPWRRTSDPYAIWVSEIMLQQTQVRTVIPYYERFMARFPTIDALASASLEEVLRFWAGLGYYGRARNLHQAARQIVEQYGGAFPENPEQIRKLPGVGPYTAGAILSIAFNRTAPILDGNAVRVLSRIFLIEGDVDTSTVRKRLWELAERIIPEGRARDFNQALMELGALICVPYEPDCPRCPIETLCRARQAGMQNRLPKTRKGPRVQRVEEVSVVLERDGRVLLGRRAPDGLWGGLWEFPRGRCRPEEDRTQCAVRTGRETIGVELVPSDLLITIRHSVMHYSIHLHALRAEISSGEPIARGYAEVRWVAAGDLASLPLSSPQARIARALSRRERGERT